MSDSATFRRRLLELADVTEAAPCFNYASLADEIEDDRLKCGSAGCMLGWATTIPEAFDAGVHFVGKHFPGSADRAAESFYGLTRAECSFLFYADNQPYDMVGHVTDLTNNGRNMSECTAKECADMLRSFADWKYPAPKPRRTEKPGTKRWVAMKLREAAKWIEEHGWTQKAYFQVENGKPCACAHGGIAAVSNKACASKVAIWLGGPDSITHAAETADEARSAAAPAMNLAVVGGGSECPEWVSEKNAWLVHLYAHMYGATFSFNDAPGQTKERVCSQLRAAAYAVEHGGQLPSWAPSEKDKKGKAAA